MELSIRYYYVDGSSAFQGTFRTSISYQFNDFLFKCQLFSFKALDSTIISTFIDNINRDPTNDEFLKKIDKNLNSEIYLKKDQVEQMIYSYAGALQKLEGHDKKERFTWPVQDKFKIILNLRDAIFFYDEMVKFSKSYELLKTMYSQVNKTPVNNQQINKSNTTIITKAEEINISNIPIKKLTIINQIMELSNKVISTFLISLSFHYYQHITSEKCNIIKNSSNDSKIINIPNIFSTDYVFDADYFKSLIFSLKNTHSDELNYKIRVILGLIPELTDPLHIMMLSFLLFVYILRHTFDSHGSWLRDNIMYVIHDPDIKIKIINHHIRNFYPDVATFISFSNVSGDVFDEKLKNIEWIQEISSDYSHIIPLSTTEFVDSVILKLDDKNERTTPLDFKITRETVLDLSDIFRFEQLRKKKTELLKSNSFGNFETDIDDENLEYHMFNYEFSNDEIITVSYRKLLKYVEDPTTLLLIKDEIPIEIKNLFEFLKSILNETNFKRTNIHTFSYYKIICENLPDPTIFTHITLLYIIYQIIIPYYFHMYKTRRFIDNLI